MTIIHTTPWLTREGRRHGAQCSGPVLSALAKLGLNVDLLGLQLAQRRGGPYFPGV